jgi:hypothetical protein
MTRPRVGALSALIAVVAALGFAGTASAQEPAATPLTKKVAVTGTKGFKGTYTINNFATRNGKIVALGTLRGTLRKKGKTKSVRRNGVIMPASVVGAGEKDLPDLQGATTAQALPNLPNSCQVLNLTLQPISLNLLGLRVRTSLINVRIDATPSQFPSGGLLGDLLCSLTNLLNPGGGLGPLTTAINNLTAALNSLLALVPTNPGTAAAAAR